MTPEITTLLVAAATIGFIHTLFGPDHYIPFIVMAKAKRWSLLKTAVMTFLCGLGHIGSSIVLGMVGVAFGIAVVKLTSIESFRGNIAAWVLIAFGLVYFIWGLRKAIRNRPHKHIHIHSESEPHIHEHTHHKEHVHVHEKETTINLTPWVLFTIFVFGPCEPLIPFLMYPAAKSSMAGMLLVTGVFGLTTIATMLGIVIASTFGLSFIPMKKMERYTHALAGATILLCGLAIQFFGL